MGETVREVSARGRTLRSTATGVVVTLFVLLFGAGLFSISQDGHPLSVVDEHIHFDTAVKALHGEIPFRGSLLSDETVQEWACGVGHEGGPTTVPCGDARLAPDSIPSGKYSTGYIHYPTYFFLAAGFQPLWAAVTGDHDLLNGFRAFSALILLLGVLASGVFAWLLRLRGGALIAAVSVPVASSMIVVTGVIVNPTSTSVLTGALIAGTGLLWMRRGRGFLWFALAVAFASIIAVTDVLPAGAMLIAMLAVLLGRRFWSAGSPTWRPRWWQFAVTVALVLIPVIVWGRVITARATISNHTLYGFIPPSGKKDVAVGALVELTSLHSPWQETWGIKAQPDGLIARLIHAISEGAPSWITVLVFGGLVFGLLLAQRRQDPGAGLMGASAARSGLGARLREAGRSVSALQLITTGVLLTVILYPPALRISNWLNFGFDFGIVSRYSSAFAPLLAFALLLLVRHRALSWTLAVVGVLTALGTVAGAI